MRVQVQIRPDHVRRIRQFMDQAGIETYKELFNDALTLLQWSIEEAKAGRRIVSLDGDRETRFMMPVLSFINRNIG